VSSAKTILLKLDSLFAKIKSNMETHPLTGMVIAQNNTLPLREIIH